MTSHSTVIANRVYVAVTTIVTVTITAIIATARWTSSILFRNLYSKSRASQFVTIHISNTVLRIAIIVKFNKTETRRLSGNPDVTNGTKLPEEILEVALISVGRDIANENLYTAFISE